MAGADEQAVANWRDEETRELFTNMLVNVMTSARQALAKSAGIQYEGARDLYKEYGYKNRIDFDDYLARYKRDGLASRVISMPADETWRDHPEVTQGDKPTPFVEAWKNIAERTSAYSVMADADRLAGIGQYGVIYLGFKELQTQQKNQLAVAPKGVESPDSLAYMRAFHQGQVSIDTWDTNETSPRFGLPVTYSVDFGSYPDDLSTGGSQFMSNDIVVHWTRVIHIAENTDGNRVYGTPRLEKVYNYFDDLMKTIGGGAEAMWLNIRQALVFTNKPDFQGLSSDDVTDFNKMMDEFSNSIRRYMTLDGLDVNQLSANVPNPSPVFDMVVKSVCGSTGIPYRKLLGNEAGELASSQDEANWAGFISSRRVNFAEPKILRAVIGRLVDLGSLPNFGNGYDVIWKPLFELNEIERADIAVKYANAFKTVTGDFPQAIIEPDEFRERYTDLPNREIVDEPDPADAVPDEAVDEINTNVTIDDLDEVFAKYHDTVNMSASELEAWDGTECSKLASVDRSPIQRNLRLLRKNKDEWTLRDIKDANRTISFVARMRGVDQGKPNDGNCPSDRDISLKNWAYDPSK